MFEIDLPPPAAAASPYARRVNAFAALALGALIVAALSFFWIKETASADRKLDPPVEDMQAGSGGAPIGLAGMIGGEPFLAMMDRAGASEAQILRIVELAQAARSDVDRLAVASAGRPAETAEAARVRIDRAMADIVAVLTPAQRARLSDEAIAVPAAAQAPGEGPGEASGRRFEISRWRGL